METLTVNLSGDDTPSPTEQAKPSPSAGPSPVFVTGDMSSNSLPSPSISEPASAVQSFVITQVLASATRAFRDVWGYILENPTSVPVLSFGLGLLLCLSSFLGVFHSLFTLRFLTALLQGYICMASALLIVAQSKPEWPFMSGLHAMLEKYFLFLKFPVGLSGFLLFLASLNLIAGSDPISVVLSVCLVCLCVGNLVKTGVVGSGGPASQGYIPPRGDPNDSLPPV